MLTATQKRSVLNLIESEINRLKSYDKLTYLGKVKIDNLSGTWNSIAMLEAIPEITVTVEYKCECKRDVSTCEFSTIFTMFHEVLNDYENSKAFDDEVLYRFYRCPECGRHGTIIKMEKF